ncbi:MAG: hypothetical protein LLF28_07200 [Nitrospiraceae bacterium]|nr:hypothetical protein [Nitrospiraceae bacterium]
MKNKGKIAVLTHSKDNFKDYGYLLKLLCDEWEKTGIKVSVLIGVSCLEPADALILHTDLTKVPDEYLAFSKHYPLVINERAADISKRRVSKNLVNAADYYDGPVIVKTDRNAGGLPELLGSKPSLKERIKRKITRTLPFRLTGHVDANAYPIFAKPDDIPKSVWRNPSLVVEKFLPEKEGNYYCLRQWIFFGDSEISQRCFSYKPIVKANNVVSKEFDLPIPKSLRTLRTELGFDYGKFDYLVVNGEAVLLDANRTPTIISGNIAERVKTNIKHLANGLNFFRGLCT